MKINIYQIFYSAATQASNDKGFYQLDNLTNLRPDWREYWPIRNCLLNNNLNENELYGFFSPKFGLKTNLQSQDVYDYINGNEADVYTFSPFYDQSAAHLNIFQQATFQHPGIYEIFEAVIQLIEPSVDISTLIMDSTNTVFCNFLVAKPAFWRVWLEKCELIYAVAEQGQGELARKLNSLTQHDGGGTPFKVFVIERIASLILCKYKFKVRAFNPIMMPRAHSAVAQYTSELCLLDSLKISYSRTGYGEFLSEYSRIRNELISRAIRA